MTERLEAALLRCQENLVNATDEIEKLRADKAAMTDFSKEEIETIIEALSMAASRHESMGHVTKGSFRYEHDDKARRMRELRRRLTTMETAS